MSQSRRREGVRGTAELSSTARDRRTARFDPSMAHSQTRIKAAGERAHRVNTKIHSGAWASW